MKKLGFIVAVAAATTMVCGGVASAATGAGAEFPPAGHSHQGGHGWQDALVNLNNLDALHNINVNPGVCDNNVNVIGVQVPVRNALNGLGIPILSPGENAAAPASPYNCSSGTIADGGTAQDH